LPIDERTLKKYQKKIADIKGESMVCLECNRHFRQEYLSRFSKVGSRYSLVEILQSF
jgi:hypothetical protein